MSNDHNIIWEASSCVVSLGFRYDLNDLLFYFILCYRLAYPDLWNKNGWVSNPFCPPTFCTHTLHPFEKLFFTINGRLAYVFMCWLQSASYDFLWRARAEWVENALMFLLISWRSLKLPSASLPNVTSRSPAGRVQCLPVIYGQLRWECVIHYSEEGFDWPDMWRGLVFPILSDIFT